MASKKDSKTSSGISHAHDDSVVWYPPGVCDLSWVHQTSTAGALVAFLQLELGTNTPGLAALDNWPVLEIPTESSGVDHFDHLPLEILRL
jgi:hypothetical protein